MHHPVSARLIIQHSRKRSAQRSGEPKGPRYLPAALLALALGMTGCLAAGGEDPPADSAAPATSQTEQALLLSDWSAPTQATAPLDWWAQIATLNGTTYMVHGSPGVLNYAMSWRQLVGNVWTNPVAIPDQTTTHSVSMAAFNGYLYMIRTGRVSTTNLWVSRFNPATGQWSSSNELPYTSLGGPPAMVAYNNQLYLIGVDPGTKNLWSATMSTSEVFSPATAMAGHYSASRVSATVYKCKLYIAHRAGNTTTIVYNSFDGQWGLDQTIPAASYGTPISAAEPVIAARNGVLHLLHRNTADGKSPLWWTYFNGISWSTEVTLSTDVATYASPGLTAGGSGLVMLFARGYSANYSSVQFYAPEPPIPPRCLGSQL